MITIGHRGARGYVAENTLESIQKALDLNVDGIEIDVFRCASGEIVVFHDKKLKRLTGHSGLIEETTFEELENILIETDSPYLSPVPNRGKLNEPSNVRYVAEKIAELKGISVDKVAEITTNNFFKLFTKCKIL